MVTPAQEHLDRLDQRRRYLDARIEAKRSVRWDTTYDESERNALGWALGVLLATMEHERATAAGAPTFKC